MTDEELIEAVAEVISEQMCADDNSNEDLARAVTPVAQAPLLEGRMDAATLMKICRAWLDNDDATHWGDFEKSLDDLLNRST